MSKVYLITDSDIEKLLLKIAADPRLGNSGASSTVLDAKETEEHKQAQRFYNYQVRTWIDEIKK